MSIPWGIGVEEFTSLAEQRTGMKFEDSGSSLYLKGPQSYDLLGSSIESPEANFADAQLASIIITLSQEEVLLNQGDLESSALHFVTQDVVDAMIDRYGVPVKTSIIYLIYGVGRVSFDVPRDELSEILVDSANYAVQKGIGNYYVALGWDSFGIIARCQLAPESYVYAQAEISYLSSSTFLEDFVFSEEDSSGLFPLLHGKIQKISLDQYFTASSTDVNGINTFMSIPWDTDDYGLVHY